LRRAGAILTNQAEDLVDTWRQVIAGHPHLMQYSAGPEGTPDPHYSAASKPRFVQWVRDTCERPYDQAWLDYQHEIALRHTRAKKRIGPIGWSPRRISRSAAIAQACQTLMRGTH
jgi:hypothetical protein